MAELWSIYNNKNSGFLKVCTLVKIYVKSNQDLIRYSMLYKYFR